MPTTHEFGNDPAKIGSYRDFWNRAEVARPLIGFSHVGWFPLTYFSACASWQLHEYITPDMLDPEDWFEDYEGLLREGETVEDDMLRGACPIQVAFPCFLPATLGNRIRVLPGNVMGDERKLPWDEALSAARVDRDNPWFRKYIEFAEALVERSNGRYPVSHGAELGPTDLHALLRGHNESLMDLMDDPQRSAELLMQLGYVFVDFVQELWQAVPLFHGGYFDAQYQLWAPGSIIRMQEDATAAFSPDLYRQLVQPVDRMIAGHFDNAFMHLHTTSMYLLDAILEIEEIACYEINIETFNLSVEEMIPYYRKVQDANRPLLIRGSVSEDEMRILLGEVDPRGLYLHIVAESEQEIDRLRPIAGM